MASENVGLNELEGKPEMRARVHIGNCRGDVDAHRNLRIGAPSAQTRRGPLAGPRKWLQSDVTGPASGASSPGVGLVSYRDDSFSVPGLAGRQELGRMLTYAVGQRPGREERG